MGFVHLCFETKKETFMLLRTLLAFMMVALATPVIQAQEDYDDLLILYVDGDYEKLINKAEKYTDKSDTRRDPQPYLYLSKAYFEMSQKEEFQEEYPKAFRDAMKYASKYRRKDKELEYWDINQEYFAELRAEAMREADLFMADKDPRGLSQAARLYKYLADINPEDPATTMMYCAVLYQINRRGEADLLMRELGPKLDDLNVEKMDEAQQEMLKFGMIQYSRYLKEDGQLDSARVTMNLGHPYFKDDNEFKLAYEEIQR